MEQGTTAWPERRLSPATSLQDEVSTQLIEQPSSRHAKRTITPVRRVDRQALWRRRIVVNFDHRERSGCDRRRHEVLGHAAPAESRQQEIESATKIDKAPKPGAGHAVIGAARVHWIQQNQLDVRRKGDAQAIIPVDYKDLISGQDMATNFLLQPGDTLVVP